MNTLKIDLTRGERRRPFYDAEGNIVICSLKLEEWFDIPSHVDTITLVVSGQPEFTDISLWIYYYPSVHDYRLLDCYGLTQEDQLEPLVMYESTVNYLAQKMDLPAQGVLNVSVEYAE